MHKQITWNSACELIKMAKYCNVRNRIYLHCIFATVYAIINIKNSRQFTLYHHIRSSNPCIQVTLKHSIKEGSQLCGCILFNFYCNLLKTMINFYKCIVLLINLRCTFQTWQLHVCTGTSLTIKCMSNFFLFRFTCNG